MVVETAMGEVLTQGAGLAAQIVTNIGIGNL